jgi:fumarate reductase flavoprotein subunit
LQAVFAVFRLKSRKTAFFNGSCSEAEVSKQPLSFLEVFSMRGNKVLAAALPALILGGLVLNGCQSSEAGRGIVYDTDVLVVGSGIAGISAAIEAADHGARVVVLEKLGFFGGASITCGGEILAAETAKQKADGIQDRWQDLAARWIERGEGRVNERMLRTIAEMCTNTIPWMERNGVEFMERIQYASAYPAGAIKRTHKTTSGTGAGFILPMVESARSKGVILLSGSPATELIVENGAVTGVRGRTEDGNVLKVNAKKVILATGGFENNEELRARYMPLIKVGSPIGEAHTGDGLIWSRDLGSPIIAGGGGIVLAIPRMLLPPNADSDPKGLYLYVDVNGRRFMDESEYWFQRSRRLMDMPQNAFYTIVDAKTLAQGFSLDAELSAGTAFAADSIEALAEKINAAPATLRATIDRYNRAAAEGRDTEFGKPAELVTPIDTAPYYAVYITLSTNVGSFGGPKINDSCQVLDAGGNPIPGLYAAGEVASGEIFYKEYPMSGSAISLYSGMGRIAGTHAASNL